MSEDIQQNRLLWVDYSKGIGISLVVIQHIVGGINRSNIGSFHEMYSIYNNIVEMFHMELFFFLSGMFVLQSIKKRCWASFLADKIRTILYPYFLWSLIYAFVFFLIPNTSNRLTLNAIDVVQIWHQPIFHFWFLHSLFVCQFLFLLFSRNKSSRLFLLAISLMLYVFSKEMIVIEMFNDYLLFFMLGFVFQELNSDRCDLLFNSTRCLVGSLLVWAVLYYITLFYYSSFAINFFVSISAIIFVISLSFALASKKRFPIILTLGMYSFPIYLVHYLAGTAARNILLKLLHVSSSWIHIPVGLIVAFAVPVIIYHLSQKTKLRFLFWTYLRIFSIIQSARYSLVSTLIRSINYRGISNLDTCSGVRAICRVLIMLFRLVSISFSPLILQVCAYPKTVCNFSVNAIWYPGENRFISFKSGSHFLHCWTLISSSCHFHKSGFSECPHY